MEGATVADQPTLHFWTLWAPGAATGIYVGRGALDPTDQLLVHAAPPLLNVEITEGKSTLLASANDLEATAETPMCLLTRRGDHITREDLWPTADHYGLPVLLPGGEVGILDQWWHANDQKEWRWQVTFYNSIREAS
jgi:hypothetical protein